MSKITVNVTADHIQRGVRGADNCNPVALAIEEATGRACETSPTQVVWPDSGGAFYRASLPADLYWWDLDYHTGGKVKPFSFEINNPLPEAK